MIENDRPKTGLSVETNGSEQRLIEDLRQHQWELQQQNEELQRTHNELSRMSLRYLDLWNNAPVGYVRLQRNGTIVAANRRAKVLLGQCRTFSDTSLIQSYLTAQSQRVFRQHIDAVRSNNGGAAELRLGTTVAQDETWLRIESTIADGELRSILTDISAEKRAETARLQSQKLEVLHNLSGGIAHDFNNILQVISAYGQLIRNGLQDSELSVLADALLDGVARGASLTERLLAYSRKPTLQTLPIDVREVVGSTVEIMRRTSDPTIKLDVCIPSQPVVARADANQLHHALLNLCINACDAMAGGGQLYIGLEIRDIGKAPEPHAEPSSQEGGGDVPVAGTNGEFCVVTIADSGVGMDDVILERAFEPFFTTKGSGSGTGLGLAIVKGIVQQHGGFLDIDSTLSKGTRAEVFLPAVDQKELKTASCRIPDEAVVERSGRILVAEDEADIRDALSRMLRTAGFDVTLATDGQSAIEQFKNGGPFDLLLSDILMPVVSGRLACERIHELDPSLPVVLLTGYGEDVIDASFLNAHDIVLLRKPVDYDVLVMTLTEKLRAVSDKESK